MVFSRAFVKRAGNSRAQVLPVLLHHLRLLGSSHLGGRSCRGLHTWPLATTKKPFAGESERLKAAALDSAEAERIAASVRKGRLKPIR